MYVLGATLIEYSWNPQAPLDYSNVSVGNIQLAIVKLHGTGTSDAVFYNPGGPGDDP